MGMVVYKVFGKLYIREAAKYFQAQCTNPEFEILEFCARAGADGRHAPGVPEVRTI